MSGDFIDLSTIRRALVVKLRHHGDVLLTSPVFTVLKNHAPHIEIDALVYADTAEMLSGHPAISELHLIDRRWKKQGAWHALRQEWRLLKTLRARRYDLLIHLTENPRGAWLSHLLGTKYAVARAYNKKRGLFWRKSFTHLYSVPVKPRHTVETHLDSLRCLGIQPGKDDRRLVLVPGDEAQMAIDKILSHHHLTKNGFVHIHPTSRWLFKCWTLEGYVELINRLQDDGAKVVITTAPTDDELKFVGRILQHLQKPAIDLTGQLSLKQLAALTACAKLFIGVDSAPMHIAAAMQTPVVTLFGPSGDQEWGPWQVCSRVITSNHTCRPCGMDGCAGSKVSECLTTIPVDRVLGAAQELLRI